MTSTGPLGNPVDVGNVAGYQAEYIQGGFSARQGLAQFRAAGGHIADARWFQSYANVRASLANYDYVYSVDPNRLPTTDEYGTYAMGRGGQYVTTVKVQTRDKDTGLIGTRDYMHVTNTPHTPGEAEAAAADAYGGDEGDNYGQTVTGTYVTGLYITVPYSGG